MSSVSLLISVTYINTNTQTHTDTSNTIIVFNTHIESCVHILNNVSPPDGVSDLSKTLDQNFECVDLGVGETRLL